MSREAWGDPPDPEPQFCPLCGEQWHAEGCELGAEVSRRLDAERASAKLQAALDAAEDQAAKNADEVLNLRAALQWYADGLHFDKASPDAWDTVSGEPQNWWCDEAGTATVEDGSIAAMVLAGELTGEQVQALE